MIKALFDFYQVWWPQALCYWRYNGFSLSCDLARHISKGSYEFYWWEPIKVSYHSCKFVSLSHSGSEDIIVFVCHATLQDHMKALYDIIYA